MYQVLFKIPLPWWGGIPIYGFGTMLVVALFLGIWIASRRAKHNDVNPEHIQDAAFWIVIAGIVGARLVHMIQFRDQIEGNWITEFFMFWKGGLVFYGALIGGVVGYVLAWKFVLKKHKLSAWKLADIIVPSVALGMCFGRIGCLLNGCCYGAVAPQGAPALHFPANSYAGKDFMGRPGQATKAAGFQLNLLAPDPRTVAWVDPGTPAATVGGLKPGDVILKVDGMDIPKKGAVEDIRQALQTTAVNYTVRREGAEVKLPTFHVESLKVRRDQPPPTDVIPGVQVHGAPGTSERVVDSVPEDSPAAQAGLRKGDVILFESPETWQARLSCMGPSEWATQPKDELTLTVERDGEEVELPRFAARTVGLHPTQVYESVSTFLIFLLLVAYFPLRRRDGEVTLLFLVTYPIHRFLNELLRNDTQPVFLNMTLSQNISLLVLLAAAVLAVVVLRRPVQYNKTPAEAAAAAGPGGRRGLVCLTNPTRQRGRRANSATRATRWTRPRTPPSPAPRSTTSATGPRPFATSWSPSRRW